MKRSVLVLAVTSLAAHDSYHSAAFLLDMLKRTGTAANSMSSWVFSDIFEESGPRLTPFHGSPKVLGK